MKKLLLGLTAAIGLLTSCISEEISFDSSNQPVLCIERLDMAPLLSGQLSPTYRFKVYNPANKGISINSITVEGNTDGVFRFNVDGLYGDRFDDVVIRGGDSIYVFVDARIPDTGAGPFMCNLLFSTAGQTKSLTVEAPVIEAQIVDSPVIDAAATWQGNYYVKGTAAVEAGATLDIQPGSRLFFAPGASLDVAGTVNVQGTVDEPVVMQGDRFDDIVPGVSYDQIAGQWKGIALLEDATLEASFSSILNAENTLSLAANATANLFNCQLHNASGTVVTATEANITATGCEITDAAQNVVALTNSTARFNQCTIANFYLLVYPVSPIIWLAGDNNLDAANCIIYGLPVELGIDAPIDLQPVYFRRCLFASSGYDDANFINCLWDTAPELYVSRHDYIFDYTPKPGSPVIGAADRSLTPTYWTVDRYGTDVESDTPLGCYAPLPQP